MVRGDYNMYARQPPMHSFAVCPPHVFYNRNGVSQANAGLWWWTVVEFPVLVADRSEWETDCT